VSGAREVKTQQQWACGIAIDGSKKRKFFFIIIFAQLDNERLTLWS